MRRALPLLLADMVLIVIATLAALDLRENLDLSYARVVLLAPYLAATLLVAIPVWLAFGIPRSIWRLTSLGDYVRVAVAALLTALVATAATFLLNRLDGVARALPVMQAILMVCLLVGARLAVRQRHLARRRRKVVINAVSEIPRDRETIVIVGLNRVTELFLQSLEEFGHEATMVAGLIGHNQRHAGRLVQQQRVLGVPEQIDTILRDLEVRGISVDRIVVTTRFEELPAGAKAALIEVERSSNIQLDFFAERILPSPAGRAAVSRPRDPDGDTDDIAFTFTKAEIDQLSKRHYWRAKRVVDVVMAASMILLLSPLFVVVAVLVAIDVGFPVTFWQQRPGLYGRPFRLYKMRTMAAAHDSLGRRLPDSERVGAIGKFLRRTRLDELPQLYHILVGEMSFVGPRPLLPADQPAAYAARLLVRPGLTGWAQVKGGRTVTPRDKAALDVWYVCYASLALDMAILVMTVPMIVRGERVDEKSIERAWGDLLDAGICNVS